MTTSTTIHKKAYTVRPFLTCLYDVISSWSDYAFLQRSTQPSNSEVYEKAFVGQIVLESILSNVLC